MEHPDGIQSVWKICLLSAERPGGCWSSGQDVSPPHACGLKPSPLPPGAAPPCCAVVPLRCCLPLVMALLTMPSLCWMSDGKKKKKKKPKKEKNRIKAPTPKGKRGEERLLVPAYVFLSVFFSSCCHYTSGLCWKYLS